MPAIRRARANDGHKYSIENRQLVSTALAIAVLGAPVLERKKPRAFSGPKPHGGGPQTRLTDEQVAHMRWLHGTMSRAQLAAYFGVERHYIDNVVDFKVRSHIEPKCCATDSAVTCPKCKALIAARSTTNQSKPVNVPAEV